MEKKSPWERQGRVSLDLAYNQAPDAGPQPGVYTAQTGINGLPDLG